MANKRTPPAIEMLESDESDSHWYTNDCGKTYLPSVSTVLGILKDGLEFVSPYELRKAQERGKRVHLATEHLEGGQTLLKTSFTAKEYDMLGGFINWHHQARPQQKLTECKFANKKLGYAGTLDRLYVMPDGRHVLVDIKTTSAIYDKAWLQVAAYAALAEKEGHPVTTVAILRLTDRSKAKFQYEERDRTKWQVDLKAFNKVLATWQYLNGDAQPKVSELPDTLKL